MVAPPVGAPVAAEAERLAIDHSRIRCLSKELKRAGFRFVGPTTVYSTMQACGVVNDHLLSCHVHDEVEREIADALAA